MNLGNKDPEGNDWVPNSPQELALHRLGADLVAFDKNGHVFVEPEIDLSDYTAKLNEISEEWLAPKINAECKRRILERIDETTQRNIIAYSIKLLKDAHVLDVTLTNEQKADLATADAIWEWINGENGMLEKSRNLIQNKDFEFIEDNKWPDWNDAWSELVDRF